MVRIMIVDDLSEILQLTQEVLGSAGHEVEIAQSGKECLEKVGVFRPELILLDIGMPGMDGWKLLEKLENSGTLDGARVAVFTVRPYLEQDARHKKLIAGYIRKPFMVMDLLEDVTRILGTNS